MMYHDSQIERMPKYTLWRKIELPEDVSISRAFEWCKSYDSTGRFYRKKRTIYHYAGHHTRTSVWHFEFEEDAVVFALMFL